MVKVYSCNRLSLSNFTISLTPGPNIFDIHYYGCCCYCCAFVAVLHMIKRMCLARGMRYEHTHKFWIERARLFFFFFLFRSRQRRLFFLIMSELSFCVWGRKDMRFAYTLSSILFPLGDWNVRWGLARLYNWMLYLKICFLFKFAYIITFVRTCVNMWWLCVFFATHFAVEKTLFD